MRVTAGRGSQRDDVAQHIRVYRDRFDSFSHRDEVAGGDHLGHRRRRGSSAQSALEHFDLEIFGQVPQLQPDREPVQLRLRQRVGALVLDRVVRR
ncbi:Uncharacterised protein [Mycobacteroides abscessus subsp. massiliense]|nr:Uncharacterised protein [Mycobacteroides abscessus subsp. massiliense]